ncbi:DUF4282 domain-containing protein [Paenarthrobacter sp. PH39-S1]|uniref:DUF4282 domain-containing protein n=1 Tax=Paenarthrobacter sp. PH39-S1 TaxID=3046204 RepID=UPI0024BAF47B|nr:DUF4282 domain-containing protein [Paenarthrobacter sp. PH39-S1]MDJ0358009.1 DUF4282 domain-containing protein [Paenarthrobacter sp. PH39-S1]
MLWKVFAGWQYALFTPDGSTRYLRRMAVTGVPLVIDAPVIIGESNEESFDLSFDRYIAPTVAKIVYILAMVGIGLSYVIFVIAAFNQNGLLGYSSCCFSDR